MEPHDPLVQDIDTLQKGVSIGERDFGRSWRRSRMSDFGLQTVHGSGRASQIEIFPFDAPLGAEIRCGDLRRVNDAQFAQIRKAWLDHLVLVFRGQDLTDDDLLKLGARFGTLDDTIRPQPANQPGQHRAPRTAPPTPSGNTSR